MTVREAIEGFKVDNSLLSENEGGTIERNNIAIEALEKQESKQVGYICGALGEKYECPECGSGITDTDLFAGHCKWCGQAIKDN